MFSFPVYEALRDVPCFPTRRSSDLPEHSELLALKAELDAAEVEAAALPPESEPDTSFDDIPEVESMDLAAEHAERSEEHTSELQSQSNLVCRLLPEKKKKQRLTTKS